jgi:hypothetical protein
MPTGAAPIRQMRRTGAFRPIDSLELITFLDIDILFRVKQHPQRLVRVQQCGLFTQRLTYVVDIPVLCHRHGFHPFAITLGHPTSTTTALD